jgi:1-acyl-sn-glycerol-3-phosphate acyltransferase
LEQGVRRRTNAARRSRIEGDGDERVRRRRGRARLPDDGLALQHWFRTECHGIEKLPPGRVMLVANHGSHALAFDGASILTACLFEAEPPRIVRPMADHRLMELPMLGTSAKRIGAVDGRPTSCINLLRDGATCSRSRGHARAPAPLPRPLQARAVRLRLRARRAPARAPDRPVAVIGCEEEAPLLANPRWLRRLVGTHSAPITPTLVFPLPAKHRLWFGDPIHLTGPITSGTVSTGVRLVREALATLLADGLAAREHVFW